MNQPRSRRFSITTLLLVIAFLGILLGWLTDHLRMSEEIRQSRTETIEAQHRSMASHEQVQAEQLEVKRLESRVERQRSKIDEHQIYLSNRIGEPIDKELAEKLRLSIEIDNFDGDWGN